MSLTPTSDGFISCKMPLFLQLKPNMLLRFWNLKTVFRHQLLSGKALAQSPPVEREKLISSYSSTGIGWAAALHMEEGSLGINRKRLTLIRCTSTWRHSALEYLGPLLPIFGQEKGWRRGEFQQTLSLPRKRGVVSCFHYKYHMRWGGGKEQIEGNQARILAHDVPVTSMGKFLV